jgi:hypothetical protein
VQVFGVKNSRKDEEVRRGKTSRVFAWDTVEISCFNITCAIQLWLETIDPR